MFLSLQKRLLQCCRMISCVQCRTDLATRGCKDKPKIVFGGVSLKSLVTYSEVFHWNCFRSSTACLPFCRSLPYLNGLEPNKSIQILDQKLGIWSWNPSSVRHSLGFVFGAVWSIWLEYSCPISGFQRMLSWFRGPRRRRGSTTASLSTSLW